MAYHRFQYTIKTQAFTDLSYFDVEFGQELRKFCRANKIKRIRMAEIEFSTDPQGSGVAAIIIKIYPTEDGTA